MWCPGRLNPQQSVTAFTFFITVLHVYVFGFSSLHSSEATNGAQIRAWVIEVMIDLSSGCSDYEFCKMSTLGNLIWRAGSFVASSAKSPMAVGEKASAIVPSSFEHNSTPDSVVSDGTGIS